MSNMLKVITAALMVFGGAAVANAEGFQSPTGNIVCYHYGDGVRCDINQTSNRPPPRPADCDLEWGSAFDLGVDSRRGYRLCYGDSVGSDFPVLNYGRTFSRGGISCRSERKGMTCTNRRGAGFFLSRASQRLF